jgi:uncharacterized protein (DUF58 family)
MIVPDNRLLWGAAAIALPAATIAGLVPVLAIPAWSVIGAAALIAAVDAYRGLQRLSAVTATAPVQVRLTKDVGIEVPLAIGNRTGSELRLRLAPTRPEGVHTTQPVIELAAPSGDSSALWPCASDTRGDHRLRELHMEAASPLGLWSARTARPLDCALRVYPNLRDHATAALFLRTDTAGARLRRQRGKGKEFENLRQYLPGDSFEDVHWKATARRAFPMVKLYSIEHAQEVYAVIDASRLSAREGILDSYVDAALHLALIADRQRDRFGLVTFGDRTHTFVRARTGMAHFRLCRESIYRLAPQRVSPDFREVFTTLQTNLRRRALLVFFTSLDDALLAESFEREVAILARRHLVLVNVMPAGGAKPLFTGEVKIGETKIGEVKIGDIADLDAAYAGLAGQLAWNRMRRLQIALQNRGVRLSFVDPERIKAQVTSGYLEVKRRQVL